MPAAPAFSVRPRRPRVLLQLLVLLLSAIVAAGLLLISREYLAQVKRPPSGLRVVPTTLTPPDAEGRDLAVVGGDAREPATTTRSGNDHSSSSSSSPAPTKKPNKGQKQGAGGRHLANAERIDNNSTDAASGAPHGRLALKGDARTTLRRVGSLETLKRHRYFRFFDPKTSMWLSRAIDTNVESSEDHEKIFRISFNKHYSAYAIKGHTRLHLTCEADNKITLDRTWTRSYEMWAFRFSQDPVDRLPLVFLQVFRNSHLVSVAPDRQSLVGESDSEEGAVAWHMYAETRCDDDVSCWGEVPKMKLDGSGKFHKLPSSSGDEQPRRTGAADLRFPLFGSPKPLAADHALQPTNPYDSFIISQRTISNWGSIDGMDALIFADDDNTQALVNAHNSHIAAAAADGNRTGASEPRFPIRLEKSFELHPKFKQPTYRGLFRSAFRLFPDARAVMYSNSDILYSPSVVETIRRVVDYSDRERVRVEARGGVYNVRGWMIVGQRINYIVPVDWHVAGNPMWVNELELGFARKGKLFQTNAEDYFIVSRGLFNWDEMPDFVVGGVAFDNWIVSRGVELASRGEAIVVDASKTITALHQNHHDKDKVSHNHPKSAYNLDLVDRHGGVHGGKTSDGAYATERHPNGVVAVYDKHRLLFL